jgi:probable rRNA maturation factor
MPSLDLAVQYASTLTNLPSIIQFRKWAKAAIRINTEVTIRMVDEAEGLRNECANIPSI